MSTYTCPHCGERGLSTQKRHNCPEAPSLSIPLGPPRSRDPIANEYIDRLSRELEKARALIRELAAWPGLVWTGTRVACAYCGATARYGVEHDRDCLIERARRTLAKDTEANDGE